MKCTEQQPYTQSGCKMVGGGRDFAIHPRLCAEQARVRGADGFQFFAKGDHTWCVLKQCDSVDMKWKATAENWQVFSQACGLPQNRAEIAGTCRTAITGNLVYPRPKRSVCKNGLKFKTVTVNNLGGLGPNMDDESLMRVVETLPGVDLVIRPKAEQNYVAHDSSKNGNYLGKFGRINMKAGTSTIFNFQFVRSGTMQPVKVKEFVFTLFNIAEYKGCFGRMSVNASHYWSYHVSDGTEVITKTDAGAPGRAASSVFMSSMAGTGLDNPSKPRELTAEQAKRSVTLVFKNRRFFNLGFDVSDAPAGKNLLFGGKSSLLDNAPCAKKR